LICLLIVKKFPEIKVTFNLVPSLLKQLKEYENGSTDIFIEHTIIPAEELSEEQKAFILENFFLQTGRIWSIFSHDTENYLKKRESLC